MRPEDVAMRAALELLVADLGAEVLYVVEEPQVDDTQPVDEPVDQDPQDTLL